MYSIGILGLLISQIVKEHTDRKDQALTKVRSKPSNQSGLIITSADIGGAEEDRTPDLLRARQALSQLSYGPLIPLQHYRYSTSSHHRHLIGKTYQCSGDVLVGLGRFERPTSPLSGVRSNQLSYRPKNSVYASLTCQTSKRVGPVWKVLSLRR